MPVLSTDELLRKVCDLRPAVPPPPYPTPMKLMIIDMTVKDRGSSSMVCDFTCCNEMGNSIHVRCGGYFPSFYVQIPHAGVARSLTEAMKRMGWNFPTDPVVVKRHNFIGYRPSSYKDARPSKNTFLRVTTKTQRDMRAIARSINNGNLTSERNVVAMEHTIAPVSKMCSQYDIHHSSWIMLMKYEQRSLGTDCQLELMTQSMNHIRPCKGMVSIPPFVQASFDIECMGSQGFPDPHVYEDQVFQIGISFQRMGQATSDMDVVLCLKETHAPDDCDVWWCDREWDLLDMFAQVMRYADVWVGYNIFGFDLPYMAERALRMDVMGGSLADMHRTLMSTHWNETTFYAMEGKGNRMQTDRCMAGTRQDDMEGMWRAVRAVLDDGRKLRELLFDMYSSSSSNEHKSIDSVSKLAKQSGEKAESIDDTFNPTKQSAEKGVRWFDEHKRRMFHLWDKEKQEDPDEFKTSQKKYRSSEPTEWNAFAKDFASRSDEEYVPTDPLDVDPWTPLSTSKYRMLHVFKSFEDIEDLRRWRELSLESTGGRPSAMWRMSRHRNTDAYLRRKKLHNAAMGKNFLSFFQLEGRVLLDMYHIVKTSLKETSYKLDSICSKYVGQQKVDLKPTVMFDKYKQGPHERMEVASYCIQDCRLVLMLMAKMHTQISMIEMSRVSRTSWHDIMTKGQQIKVFNLIVSEIHTTHVINDQALKGLFRGAFSGAVVIEPLTGFYTENDGMVIVLDFASLYPSIMQELNLCYSTLVLPDSSGRNLKGVTDILGARKDEVLQACTIDTETVYHYAKPTTCKGILPRILVSLLNRRAQAKKDMKAAPDDNMREIQNRRQLALKVTANSLYGFTGVSNGMLPCKPIAATVTNRGRELIELTQRLVIENVPETKMLYGDTDSVMFLLMTKFPTVEDAIRNAIQVGTNVGEWITERLQPPHNLEFEKVARRFALFGKKRYWMRAVTTADDMNGYLDIKGDETVRRDSCALMVESGKRMQQLLMYQDDPHANILALLSEYANHMVHGTIDMSKLIISKSLNSTTKTLAQVHVATKIAARIEQEQSQREPPRSGDRVDFVIMKMPQTKACKFYQQAEDPEYVRRYSIPLDMLYYMEKQFWNALRRKLAVFSSAFLGQCDDIMYHCRQRLALQNRLFDMKHQGMGDISRFFVTQGDAQPMHPRRTKRPREGLVDTTHSNPRRRTTSITAFLE